MNWPNSFSDRLASWNVLRKNCQNTDLETALSTINSWWFQTPWRPYYLHWDDQEAWPDPWQLLSDNIFCEVARGLGILYTLTLLERSDMAPVDLILSQDGHNLVLVGNSKYILNWESDSVVNTFQEVKIKRQYKKQQIT